MKTGCKGNVIDPDLYMKIDFCGFDNGPTRYAFVVQHEIFYPQKKKFQD